jgi:tetratricopeptide (TPR) repeat protein
VGWLGDRFSFGFLPDPLRWAARRRRAGQLRRALAVNPHDRRARLELADLLLARRPAEAAALARRNVEAGDEDAHTAFLYGAALARSGALDDAERALAFARERDPAFRLGEIDLELGRLRLRWGDFAGAREALERLVRERPGTVAGRYFLARALVSLGDPAGAARVRQEALREYAALPRFRRRQERPFAARLRPVRTAIVLAAALAGIVAVVAAWALRP